MKLFSRRKKNTSEKIVVRRGDDVRVYTKAGSQLGMELIQEETKAGNQRNLKDSKTDVF